MTFNVNIQGADKRRLKTNLLNLAVGADMEGSHQRAIILTEAVRELDRLWALEDSSIPVLAHLHPVEGEQTDEMMGLPRYNQF